MYLKSAVNCFLPLCAIYRFLPPIIFAALGIILMLRFLKHKKAILRKMDE